MIGDIAGDALLPESLARLAKLDPSTLPLVPSAERIGPCVGRIGKFICIGLNYADHAAESNLPVPSEPVVFNKWLSAVVGPNDDVRIPRGSKKTDWEVELGVVIGKGGAYIDEADALSHVAGYCVINDVSEREYQIERGGTWDKGKGCDTFGPIGPWLVTADEVPDPHKLAALARSRRQALSERQHRHDDLQGRARSSSYLSPLHEPATGRRHLDRHAAGRRHGAEAGSRSICAPGRRCASASKGSANNGNAPSTREEHA